MNKKILFIIQIISYFGICNSQDFIADKNCLYLTDGATLSFIGESPQIDFYIPHIWINNEDQLNYLYIKMIFQSLSLRHPLSLKKDNKAVDLPLGEMKIGWNTIFVNIEGNNLKTFLKTQGNDSVKIIKNVSLPIRFFIGFARQFVTGLHSLVNCLKEPNTRYYNIPSYTSVTIPYVMYKDIDKFEAYSDSNSFSFEISLSGKRRKVCKAEFRDKPDFYSIPKTCENSTITSFSQDTVYRIFIYRDVYNFRDILRHNDFTFAQFVLHNTGNTDFLIRTFITAPGNAPISLLKVEGSSHTKINTTVNNTINRDVPPITNSSEKPSLNDTAFVNMNNDEEGEYALVWIILASVFGVLLLLLIVGFIILYVKFYYTKTLLEAHSNPDDERLYTFSGGFSGYETSDQRVTRNSSFIEPNEPEIPTVPDQLKRTEEDLCEEYHYYEKYHSQKEKNQETEPKYENYDSSNEKEKKYCNA